MAETIESDVYPSPSHFVRVQGGADIRGARWSFTETLWRSVGVLKRGLISRVVIFMDWIPNAHTLTEVVRNWPRAQFVERLPAVAEFLVSCANRGLVHGRHSSENILVSDERGYQLIDFSHAQIYSKFNARGFIHDAARIGSRLLGEGAASRAAVNSLFEEIAHVAQEPAVSAAALARECDWIMGASKQRQRLKRNVRTFWRGTPFRLRRN